MEQKPFDFAGLSKKVFNDWKRFFRDNFVFTKLVNPKDISDPIAKAIEEKEIPIVSADEISSPIVDALYKVQEAVELKEGIEEVSVKNIESAKIDTTEIVSVLKEIRDKEDAKFPEIPEPKESVKIEGEVSVAKPKWFEKTDLSETNNVLKEIAKKEYPALPKFPEFPSFSDIFEKALSPIKDVLEKILSKPEKENPPFEFDEFGRVKVNVDRAGGGGGGTATEENQEKLIGDETPMVAIDGVYVYIGKAPAGTSTSASSWKIKRLDTTSGIIGAWADGNTNYDNVWDNHASLTYL